MSLKTLLAAVTVASAGLFLTATEDAHASQWGCEVLLCASSSSPSWRGVPACHPPMHRLISAMRGWGFSWPTCPEAGTGKPGYEQYEDCPAGWSIGYTEFGMGGRSEPDICTQTTNTCGSRFGGRDGCTQTVSMPRPVRDDPYYFDIRNDDGITSRHWFSLRK